MARNPAAQALIDTNTATRKAERAAQRDAELKECMIKLNALLAEYDAMLVTNRVEAIAADGTLRYRYEHNVQPRPV
ncbi:MAG TPA: hypothetical protein VH374_26410 [Polyangia bacterium]|jgi:hypothetical protein|nr:hypothetical protein [Polyangia bacterium]